jgi:hypothetical protein
MWTEGVMKLWEDGKASIMRSSVICSLCQVKLE